MRFLWLGLPLLVVVGCSVVQEDEAGSSADRISEDGKKNEGSVAYGPCAASRSAILASVSSARAAAISRGFEWLDADVPFDMRATHDAYRTDCSGFVSMCWELPSPGRSTRDFGRDGTGSHKLDSYDALVPADALVRAGQHSVIFLGWNDTSKTGACVLEQSSTKNDMQFRVRLTATLRRDGFLPVRADTFRNDTTYRPTATGSSTDTGTGGADPAEPSTDEPSTNEPSTPAVCTSRSAATICAEARRSRDVQCGRLADDCGRPVDCNAVQGFGCQTNEKCTANKCTSACTPRSAIDVCLTGRLAQGVECGKVSDGCGGMVDCDALPMFGCGTGQTCGATAPNRCPVPPPSATPDAGTAPTPAAPTPPEAQGDPGDDNEPMSPSSRTGSDTSDDDGSDDAKPAKKSKPVSSSGCSAAPTTGGASGGALALFAFAAVATRRRRRPAAR